MKTLLVILLVSGLVAESSAWPSLAEFKENAKARFGDVGSFFKDLGKKAKDFVTGKKGEFETLANNMKQKIEKLEDCAKCEDGGCNDERDVECETLFINYEKVRDFMDCAEDRNRKDCELNLGRSASSPPKRELSENHVDVKQVEEEEDAAEEQQQVKRRLAVLLKELSQRKKREAGYGW